jgi:type IV secretory pathway protease TraF
VCATGPVILINRRIAALRPARDPSGRPMPSRNGCRTLSPGKLFLLGQRSALAFYGRYFGITRAGELIGKAKFLWHG